MRCFYVILIFFNILLEKTCCILALNWIEYTKFIFLIDFLAK